MTTIEIFFLGFVAGGLAVCAIVGAVNWVMTKGDE